MDMEPGIGPPSRLLTSALTEPVRLAGRANDDQADMKGARPLCHGPPITRGQPHQTSVKHNMGWRSSMQEQCFEPLRLEQP